MQNPAERAGSANLPGYRWIPLFEANSRTMVTTKVEMGDAYGPSDVARKLVTGRGQNRFLVLTFNRRGLAVRAAGLLNINLARFHDVGKRNGIVLYSSAG